MVFLQVSGIYTKQESLSGVNSLNEEPGNYILKDIGFVQQKFQRVAIAGGTGEGKTTLMKTIGGLCKAEKGEVLFETKRVKGPDEVLLPGHPGIAYLSQHFELHNNYRVEEVLAYYNKFTEKGANRIFQVCRVDHLLKRKTTQLSGGERQRIALARLLVGAPRLLLLDEPYSNLDMISKKLLKGVIDDLGQQLGITCMLTSHDPLDLLSWADKILVLKEGQIIQRGTPEEIYHRPADEYTAGLFGSYNKVSTDLAWALMPKGPNGKDDHSRFNENMLFQDGGVFLRPERFRLNAGEQRILRGQDIIEGKDGVQGQVQKLTFNGSYTEMEILIGDEKLIVKSVGGGYREGDLVYISLSREG
ncbi:ABC transporter ATP-binding protein [Flavitalea flava]